MDGAKKESQLVGLMDELDNHARARDIVTKATGDKRHPGLESSDKTLDASSRPTVQSRHSTETYRADIDGLRALAILPVVAFHAFPEVIRGGFVGVDVFFVISGYLITRLIVEKLCVGVFSFNEFYSRRIKRIFPATIAVLVSCYIMGWYALMPSEYMQLGKHIAGGSGFISNFILWNESGYFDNASNTKPLLHMWSLGIEEQFYIIWPLVLYFVNKHKIRPEIIAILFFIFSFSLNILSVHNYPVAAFYSPGMRVWELSIGSILAIFTIKNRSALDVPYFLVATITRRRIKHDLLTRNYISQVASIIGFALILGATLMLDKNILFPGWWALMPTAGAGLLILSGPKAIFNRKVLSNRILVWVGLISFPLYLWHWPLLSFGRIVFSDSFSIRVAAVFVSFVLAWLTYILIERPIRFGSSSKLIAPLLCAGMAAIGCVGYYTFICDGLSLRPIAVKSAILTSYNAGNFYKQTGCFLTDLEISSFNTSECLETKFSGRPTVFLIGDSYSAYLSRGLKAFLDSQQINIGQFSSAFCLPLSRGEGTKRCAGITASTLDKVAEFKPDVLILFAKYENYVTYDPDGLKVLPERVEQLKAAGAKKIIVLGQPPTWEEDLPKLILRKYLLDGRKIPIRTLTGVEKRSLDVDETMKSQHYADGISYISLKDALCNQQGCLTLVGDDIQNDLISFDEGHLTQSGADYITKEVIAPLLETMELHNGTDR